MRYSIGLMSLIIYGGVALTAASAFLAVTLVGEYSWVARLGGAAWVFLLSTIVLMPLVIPWVKRRRGG